MRVFLSVTIALLLVTSVFAQNATEPAFEVGDVVRGTTTAYQDKTGVVTNVELDKIYVRWENADNAIGVEPDKLEKTGGPAPPETFAAERGEVKVLETHQVRELFNEVKEFYETGTCEDGIKNQGETGIDCGGPCLLCETTPAPDIQNIETFQSKRTGVQLDQPKKRLFGTPQADAIPAPMIASDDVSRIAKAIGRQVWARDLQEDVSNVRDSMDEVREGQQELTSKADTIKSRVESVNTNVNTVGERVAEVQRPITSVQSQVGRLSQTARRGSLASLAAAGIVFILLLLLSYLVYAVYQLKTELHEVTQTTPEDIQRIQQYFAKMLDRGYEPTVIKEELAREGFSRATVDMAYERMS